MRKKVIGPGRYAFNFVGGTDGTTLEIFQPFRFYGRTQGLCSHFEKCNIGIMSAEELAFFLPNS